jgi:hypothetical protein
MSEVLQKRDASSAPLRERASYVTETWSWAAAGWIAGFIGALVVALFFLVIDLMLGRPLWTPGALGSALFLGQRLLPDAAPQPALVAGYTAIHFLVFVAFGLITATAWSVRPHKRGPIEMLAIGVGIFAACELSFAAFAWLFSPTLWSDLGVGSITASNALAAVAMAVFLGRVTRLRMPMDRDG